MNEAETTRVAGTAYIELSRRNLLRMAGVGAGVLAAAGFLPGCSTGSAEGGSDGETPQPGGDFAGALATGFPDLDASVIPYAGSLVASLYWAERLYRLDPFQPGEYLPELATGALESVSPTTFRIALREGVVFHDGNPMTADDVVFSLQFVKAPENGSLWQPFLDIIDEVRAVGTHEIEMTTTSPATVVQSRLALVHIRPKTATAPFQLEPIGTGPYRVTSARSDEEIILELFDGYTGDRPLTYDRIELKIVTDDSARMNGLRTNLHKAIDKVPTSAIEELSNASGIDAEAVDSTSAGLWQFHCGKPPFDDVRMRQAVGFALDREAIVQTGYLGHAEPAWSGYLPTSHPQFTEPELVYRYDPDHARSLIASAGHTSGEPIPIDIFVTDGAVFAPIVEENLRAVGFAPNLIPTTSAAMSNQMSEGGYNLQIAAGGGGDLSFLFTQPELGLRLSYTGFVVDVQGHWASDRQEELVGLLDSVISAGSDEESARFLAEALNLVQNEIPLLPIYHLKTATAWSEELHGFRPSPSIGLVLDGVSG